MNIELIQGNCLTESDKIKDGSVDLILTDLPYQTMKGISNPKRPKSWGNKDYFKWDVIDLKAIVMLSERILRKNGKAPLFFIRPRYATKIRPSSGNTIPSTTSREAKSV